MAFLEERFEEVSLDKFGGDLRFKKFEENLRKEMAEEQK